MFFTPGLEWELVQPALPRAFVDVDAHLPLLTMRRGRYLPGRLSAGRRDRYSGAVDRPAAVGKALPAIRGRRTTCAVNNNSVP